MSDSVQSHRWQPTRLPCPWDSPGKNTGVGCHFLLQCMKVKIESEVAQSCLTLSDPMVCSPPGSSIHGIFQASVLEWYAIAFSGRRIVPADNTKSPSWITALLWLRALYNLMKLWTIPSRATQDGLVIVKRSDKTWPTGGGNGKPL